MSTQNELFRQAIANLTKHSMAPVEQIGAAPPPPPPAPAVDPATGMPMDPAAAGMPPGGAMPMDPAAGGMPMDPAMMGGMPPMDPSMMPPPGEDPLMKILEGILKKVSQTQTIVATIADQLNVRIPLNETLDAGEDIMEDALKPPAGAGGGDSKQSYERVVGTDGFAAQKPAHVIDMTAVDPAQRFSAAARVAARYARR